LIHTILLGRFGHKSWGCEFDQPGKLIVPLWESKCAMLNFEGNGLARYS
jgi:hypothetical protein